jgi:hypothetical protein
MKKSEIINEYKYVYNFNKNGNLINAKMYKIKFKGLIKTFEGNYDLIYDNNGLLQSQKNYFKNIGITESVNYYFDNSLLIKKEYYNDKMSLRYYIFFRYNEFNKPNEMIIYRYNDQILSSSKNRKIIEEYLLKTGKEIDFLSDMLDLSEKLSSNV